MADRLYNVEQAIFAHLQTLLPDSDGTVGELPRAATSETPRLWMFGLGGGPEALKVEPNTNIYAWEMNASFTGAYASREDALDDLWLLMDALPLVTSDIPQITRIDPIGPYNIFRQVVRTENDLDTGGEIRIWAIELPLIVTFERT